MTIENINHSGYKKTNKIKESFSNEAVYAMKEFYRFCTMYRSIAYKIIENTNVNKAAAYIIFDMLLNATLGFGKPFESLELARICNGKEDLFQLGCQLSERSIRRLMEQLEEANVIVFVKRHGRPTLYGMNIKLLIDKMSEKFSLLELSTSSDQNSRQRDAISAWNRIKKQLHILETAAMRIHLLSDCASQEENDVTANEILIKKVVCCKDMKSSEVVEVMHTENDTNSTVRVLATEQCQVDERTKEISEMHTSCVEKANDKAIQQTSKLSLFDSKGKAMSRNGMALWDSLAVHFQHIGYEPRHTGKVFGQMKCWLDELAKRGMSENEIREKMSDIVRRWKHIARDARIPATSREDKPYHTNIDAWPHFSSYYPHREHYAALLMAADVPLAAYSDKERANVDFKRHNIF